MRQVGLFIPTISPVVGSQIVNTCAYGSTGGVIVVNSNCTFVNLLIFIAPDGCVEYGLVSKQKL